MIMNVCGQKLPPLPTKANLTAGGFTAEQAILSENREDEPLLLREASMPISPCNSKALKDVSNMSQTQGECSATVTVHTKKPTKASEYSTFDKTAVDWQEHDDTNTYSSDVNEKLLCTSHPTKPLTDHSLTNESNRESSFLIAAKNHLAMAKDSEPNPVETESFELRLMGDIGTMSRSKSSYGYSKDSRRYQRRGVNHEQVAQGEGHRRMPLSRSQSHPLTMEEVEYSQYWRGDVTIIKTPEAALPDVKSNSEAVLDDKMGTSALTMAITQGRAQLVLECLRQGENPLQCCSNTGRTYFHVIANSATSDNETTWVPMIYQFSNAGLDVNARDSAGRTAVRLAIMRRLVQILAALLKCGAETDAGDEYFAEQVRGVVKSEIMEVIRRLTPSYWSAVHDLTPFKVKRLVQAWSRINISRNGQTLIEFAKQNAKDETIVKMLLQNEASVELAHAVMAGDTDRSKVLLCDGAVDIKTCDTSVKNNYFEPFSPMTLLGAAIKYGHSEVITVLRNSPQAKALGAGKIDCYVDVSATKGEEAGSYGRQKRLMSNSSNSSTNSLIGAAYHYGSTSGGASEMRDSESVTSMLCVIL